MMLQFFVLTGMDRRYKGRIGEQKVILRALEKGWQVNLPVVPGRYDLVLDDGSRLYRTQVKYTDNKPSKSSGSVTLSLWRRGLTYRRGEVDLLLVYIPKIDRIVAFNPDEFCGKGSLTIRFEGTKNNQSSGVCQASDRFW